MSTEENNIQYITNEMQSIEKESLKLFRDGELYKSYLKCVSHMPGFKWQNVYRVFIARPDIKSINTSDGWECLGYSVLPGSVGVELNIPKYKTLYIRTSTGEEVDVDSSPTVAVQELLSQGILDKVVGICGYSKCKVYDVTDTNCDNIKELLPSKQKVWRYLESKYGTSDRMNVMLGSMVREEVNRMRRLESDIDLLVIKESERALIADSVNYVICQYIDLGITDYKFDYLPKWFRTLELSDRDTEIISAKCLDQVSLIAGKIIHGINIACEVRTEASEEIIDKNYRLMNLFNAALARDVNKYIVSKRFR